MCKLSYFGHHHTNCTNNGYITGENQVGGIASDNNETIENCINTGNITATNPGYRTDTFGYLTSGNGAGGIVGLLIMLAIKF